MDWSVEVMRGFAGTGLVILLLLAGCGVSTSNGDGDGDVIIAGEPQSGLETVALKISTSSGRHDFVVEVARTAEQQAHGMMFREAMDPAEGMLFPFPQPKFASFWMKDTLIPLDMIFIRNDGTIDRIAENTVPQSLEPVASGGEVSAVLELAGGTAARLEIDESARVSWEDRSE